MSNAALGQMFLGDIRKVVEQEPREQASKQHPFMVSAPVPASRFLLEFLPGLPSVMVCDQAPYTLGYQSAWVALGITAIAV